MMPDKIIVTIIGGAIGLGIGLLILIVYYKILDIRDQRRHEREMQAICDHFDRVVEFHKRQIEMLPYLIMAAQSDKGDDGKQRADR